MDPPIIGVPSDSSSGPQPSSSVGSTELPTEKVYEPLKCPNFPHTVNLPCDISDPLAIWELFFPIGQITTIMENTNQNAQLQVCDKSTFPHAREWEDVSIREVYIWLAILIYMGLYPQNDIPSYWNQKSQKPVHDLVTSSMSCNRWQQIRRYFHISLPVSGAEKVSAFSKVLSISKMVSYTNLYGNYFR
jgi:hypothetical protein